MAVEMELWIIFHYQQNFILGLKAKNLPNEKVQFHLKVNLFLELGIDFLTDFLLKLSDVDWSSAAYQ